MTEGVQDHTERAIINLMYALAEVQALYDVHPEIKDSICASISCAVAEISVYAPLFLDGSGLFNGKKSDAA